MATYILGRWFRGILLSLLGMIVVMGVNYILYSLGFVQKLGSFFILGIVASLAYSVVTCLILLAKDHIYIYEDTKFWSETTETYSRNKVLLYLLPIYITAVVALILIPILYPHLVYETAEKVTVNQMSGAAILPTCGIFLTAYALHMLAWCFRATCPKCKNVMTRIFLHKSNESLYTETETKHEKRREKIGELRYGDQKIADVEGDVTHSYDETYDIHEYTEHYRCRVCHQSSSAAYKDRTRRG